MPSYHDVYIQNLQQSCVLDFSTPGSGAWTVPTGVTVATFEVWGGGGGGGAVTCCSCYYGGPGGGGGGYSRNTITVTPGGSYTICVGQGGNVSIVGSCAYHSCCCGGAGSTSYVTGSGLSNFCATGGTAGQATCYWGCGCSVPGGCAYGGSVNQQGSWGTGGHSSNQCQLFFSAGGAPGGFSNAQTYYNSDHCQQACATGPIGIFPGGGGATNLSDQCCCCGQSGVGANGLVRISF